MARFIIRLIITHVAHPLYHWGNKLNGYPIKIDILIIYDMDKLEIIEHSYEGKDDIKKDGTINTRD